VLGPTDGRAGMLGSMGVRFMLAGGETGGGFALVEHPIPPRALAAPLHRHTHEDEYSFVLEGRVGGSSETRSSTASRAISSSSRGASGTPSGTTEPSPREYSS
jgi:hypothetical protein